MKTEKRFDEWNESKKSLDASVTQPFFHEREVRWYAAGENIGREISGKGERFSRPILIVRKYGKESFFGIPLSSKIHNGIWYADIIINGTKRTALLSQAGSFSAKRLFDKIDTIPIDEFEKIIDAFVCLIKKIFPNHF